MKNLVPFHVISRTALAGCPFKGSGKKQINRFHKNAVVICPEERRKARR